MRRIFLLSAVMLGLCHGMQAQEFYKWEIGLLVGGSNFLGDVVEPDFFEMKETNLAFGLNVRHNLTKNLAVTSNLIFAELTGNDLNSERRAARGFQFSSNITEFSFQFEYELFGQRRYNEEDQVLNRIISPYVFGGMGFLFTNTNTDFSQSIVDGNNALIQADQAEDINRTRIVIPIGIGIKMDLSDQWNIALEGGLRTAFSDYLDGISQAGDPNDNDWYGVAGIKLNYRFGQSNASKTAISMDL